MLVFVNERFLLRGQRLKVLVLAPELGATSPQPGAPPADLRLNFAILNEDESRVRVEFSRPVEVRSFTHFRVPFSYAELQTGSLAAGTYSVEVSGRSEILGRKQLLVLDQSQYNFMLEQISAEKNLRNTPIETADALSQTWLDSWRNLYSYLRAPIPQHVAINLGKLEISRSELRNLSLEAFGWVMFHVNRLVFDQVFYGGVVGLARTSEGPLQFRNTLQCRIAPLEGREPDQLSQLRQLLRDRRFSIEIKWASVSPDRPFAYQVNADVIWRIRV